MDEPDIDPVALQHDIESWNNVMDFLLNKGGTVAEAREISADEVEWIYMNGMNMINTGQFDQALDTLSTLCMLSWNTAKYWVALGFTQQRLGNPDRAIAAYCQAAMLEEDPRTAMRISECWLRLGDKPECISALESVIEWAGDDEVGQALHQAAQEMLEQLRSSDEAAAAAP
ncbi:MAG: hypothetical protein ABGZ17_30960 [Planctomycetaceae bacterium]